MKKLSFEEKLKNKIADNNKRRTELEKNKDKYRKKLKDNLIEDIEERILQKVPDYIEEQEESITVDSFYISKSGNRFYIKYANEKPEVFFNEKKDIEGFLKEIIDNFGESLKYELELYNSEFCGYIGNIKFKYEYKQS